jgi:hypothetical protein
MEAGDGHARRQARRPWSTLDSLRQPLRRDVKSREEQLTWAKQRALICVGMGRFADAVAGLRADLDKGAMSSEHAMRGYKAAMDAALGRGSQALIEWIEGFR